MMKNLDKLLSFIRDLEGMTSPSFEEAAFTVSEIVRGWIDILEEGYLPDSPTEYINSSYDCTDVIPHVVESVEDSILWNAKERGINFDEALDQIEAIKEKYIPTSTH